MVRAFIKNEMILSCSLGDHKVKAWSTSNKNLKYEFMHSDEVKDIVIGREGTPLENRLLSISSDKSCRVSNLETGVELRKINFGSPCWSIAVDKTQTLIAIGSGKKVTFIETTNFTKVKEVSLNNYVNSLAFNRQNDCMLAVTESGEIHSFKF